MKILYPFSGIMGIFFPVGKLSDGGTCEFATPKCLPPMCAAMRCIPAGDKIDYDRKKEVYRFITKGQIFFVCYTIMEELEISGCKILYWFASGDCMREHEERILEIMKYLSSEKIKQCGFTRNKYLWAAVNARREYDVRLVLTVEDKTKAIPLSEAGLVNIPDCNKGIVQLYHNRIQYVSCGTDQHKLDILGREDDCQKCYKRKKGCFSDL